MIALHKTMDQLARSESGVAMTEFALAFPFMLGVGLLGLETANRTLVQMHIEQLAIQIADNASRIGEDSVLEDRKIYESDINDLFYGAHLQSTSSVDLYSHGRVILSSLQVNPANEEQYIDWQRCMGTKVATSSYGVQGDSGMVGMGPAGLEVSAFAGEAVMFVEISYDYQPIVGDPLAFGSHEINSIASFTVRADRDLTQIYQLDPGNPAPVASCDTYQQSGLATGN